MFRYKLLLFSLLLTQMGYAQSPCYSSWVYPADDGKLVYATTDKGDRIMDYSHAGYMGGGVALPDVPVKVVVEHVDDCDDYTQVIQSAVDSVCGLAMVNGFRGAVLLSPGEYPCSGTITIKDDGVVLRGSGTPEDKQSTIVMFGNKHTAIVVNNGAKPESNNNEESPVKVIDQYVPQGTLSFTVEDASSFHPGDVITIRKPVTDKWVHFLQMDDLVRDGKPQTWLKTGTIVTVDRTIASVEGDRVTLTVPLADCYDREYTDDNTTIVHASPVARIRQSGVENLRIVSPEQAVNHGQALYYGLRIYGEDCWARDLDLFETMESVGVGGQRITLQRVSVLRKALHQGASKPAEFAPNAGQVLLDRCSVEGDNIWFVAVGARQSGPIVLLNCNFSGNGRIEGHQRWSTGFLMDNCRVPGGGIDFKNRGSMGSGHGWGTAWAVAWNCEAMSYVNQIPPGTCNWVIGSIGESTPLPRPFNREGPNLPEGIFDAHGTHVAPQSLYLAQLRERLGDDALRAIGY